MHYGFIFKPDEDGLQNHDAFFTPMYVAIDT
jgi:hypothetical protein